MLKHYNILVTGKVQGVFYRATAQKMALMLGVAGFVRNERNGDVYIEAEGEEEILAKFIQWCHHGPEKAEVTYVSVTDAAIQHFTGFEVKR
jgi:acylphosphatase